MRSSVTAVSAMVLLMVMLAPASVHAAKGGWQPETQELQERVAALETSGGAIEVEVDPAACTHDAAPCSEFSDSPATSANNNPVRLIIQVVALPPVDDLTLESFDIRTQFSSAGVSFVEPLVCPECFENEEGGTYSVWIFPGEDNWEVGTHYLRVGAIGDEGILPALARLEIPFEAEVPPNEPPVATVFIVPEGEGQYGEPVIFDGSASIDPDGMITCYQWQILSDNPDDPSRNPEIFQGPATSSVVRVFAAEQDLVVKLRVSDRDDLTCSRIDESTPADRIGGLMEPEEAFSPHVSLTSYRIACRNPPPTAIIAGPDVFQLVGPPGQTVTLMLDGTLSIDYETPIDDWIWNCGSEFPPIPMGIPAVVRCVYRVGPSPMSYTATLVVRDQGTGVIDPGTGTFACQKTSEPDTVTVEVTPFTANAETEEHASPSPPTGRFQER